MHSAVKLNLHCVCFFVVVVDCIFLLLLKAKWIEGMDYIQIGLIPGCSEHTLVLHVLCSDFSKPKNF